jgi:hypothetical protein
MITAPLNASVTILIQALQQDITSCRQSRNKGVASGTLAPGAVQVGVQNE